MIGNTINLYQQLPKEFQNRISFAKCIKVMLGIVVLVGVIWGYLRLNYYSSENALKNVIAEKNDTRKKLNVLKKKYPKIAKSVTLQGSVNELGAILELHQDLKRELESSKFSNETGFSLYFEGLSRQVVDNLWLTEIKIQKGGAYMVFKGLTNNVSIVQSLLKKLEEDQVFQSRDIKLKKIETSISSVGNDEFSLEVFPRVLEETSKETKMSQSKEESNG